MVFCLDCGTHGTEVNYLFQHGKERLLHVCVKQQCDQKEEKEKKQDVTRIMEKLFFPLNIKKQYPPQNKSPVTMQNVIIHQVGMGFCLRMKGTHAVFSG